MCQALCVMTQCVPLFNPYNILKGKPYHYLLITDEEIEIWLLAQCYKDIK